MREIYFTAAIAEALAEEMTVDQTVKLMSA